MRILAFDVGNTSVAAACFEGAPEEAPPLFAHHLVRGADAGADLERLEEHAARAGATRIAIGAVHAFGAALARRLAARPAAAAISFWDEGAAFPLARDLADPASAGVDRLAAALAAHRRLHGAARVVNAGTAVTVDWIDAGGRFRGGAIVAGRALQAKALRLFTDRLPEVVPRDDPQRLALPGRDSEQAIRHGLDVGLPSMVDALLAAVAPGEAAAPPVLVTGGDADWLAPRLATAHQRVPWLVARGLALAALGGGA